MASDHLKIGGVLLGLARVLAEAGAESVLLLLEQFKGDGIGVVGLQHARLFVFELFPFGTEPFEGSVHLDVAVSKLLLDHGFRGGTVSRGDALRDFEVVLLDAGFNLIDEDCPHLAPVLLPVPPVANEVRIEGARPALRHLHNESRAAVPAAERRFQIVIVDQAPFADAPRRERGLDEVKGLIIDDCLVTSRIADALEGHDARVVGLGEQLLQSILVEHFARHVRRLEGSKSSSSQFVCD